MYRTRDPYAETVVPIYRYEEGYEDAPYEVCMFLVGPQSFGNVGYVIRES